MEEDTSLCSGVTWTQLQSEIRKIFAEDSINIDDVKRLLKSYTSNQEDWNQHVKFDVHSYTRNLVDSGNEKYNLLVLCWSEGHGSCIHDHANSHCFMKMLSGTLKETQFHWPEQDESTSLREKASTLISTNEVTYINDTIGLHRIENPSHVDPAVSLHLYCPPIKVCHSYDERTGTSKECQVTFHNN